jgi:hypothetical protein
MDKKAHLSSYPECTGIVHLELKMLEHDTHVHIMQRNFTSIPVCFFILSGIAKE